MREKRLTPDSEQPKKSSFTKLARNLILSMVDKYRFRGTSGNLMPGMLDLSKKFRESDRKRNLPDRNQTVIQALDRYRELRENLIEKDKKTKGLMYRWVDGDVTPEEQITAEQICRTLMEGTAKKFGVRIEDMEKEMHEQISDIFPE